MALGILLFIFIGLGFLAALGQILLYKESKKEIYNEWIFSFNMVLGVIVSYMAYSELPTNLLGQRGLALVWGILAIIAIPLKIKFPKFLLVSKLLLTISLVGGLIQLFL